VNASIHPTVETYINTYMYARKISQPFLNSYCSSSTQLIIAIRLPTDATLYFVYLFPFLPYMFWALISPSSEVSQAAFIYNHLVHAVFMLLVCVCLWTDLSWWFHCTVKPPRQISPQAYTDEQHKHCMNQMVVYKKQLEIPLMMGLWGPETCRVEKEIDTQNKELHPLVTSLQYVQKMHGMNNLKNN